MNNDILPNFQEFHSVFLSHIINYLENNLDKKSCISISNLLTIDYINRLKAKPPLSHYIATCINRLKKHLKDKIILDNNFSTIMTLFAVAITEESEDNDIYSSEKAQDALIESTISELFSNLTSEEHGAIKAFIKKMINGNPKKINTILNLVKSEPERLKEIVTTALNKNIEPKKIPVFVEQNLEQNIFQSTALEKKTNRIRNFFSKIAFTSGALLTASLGVFLGGLILPALVIPSIIATIKVAPLIANKLSNIVIKESANTEQTPIGHDYAQQTKIAKQTDISLIPTIDKPTISQEKIKNLVKNIDINHIKEINAPTTQAEKIKAKEIKEQNAGKERSI